MLVIKNPKYLSVLKEITFLSLEKERYHPFLREIKGISIASQILYPSKVSSSETMESLKGI